MIRPITIEDIPQITEIYNHYVLNTAISFEVSPVSEEEMWWRAQEYTKTGPYLVAIDDDGRVMGYAYVHPWKERQAYCLTFETTVYVHPSFLHGGVGTLLMTELIARCRRLPIHALIACITNGNDASQRLHEKLGFTKVSHFKDVGMKFGKLLDVVDYELTI